jgi:hypothetical protein
MSDIIKKAQKSFGHTEDQSHAPCQRAHLAMLALNGLTLSDLNDDANEGIDVQLVAITQILARHAIESEADYTKLTDAECEEILSRIRTVCQLCLDSEAERVMRELDTAGRKLPMAAIEEVREHSDVFVPLLMQSMEREIARVRRGEEPQQGSSFFAFFLLTELKVDEAFPIILDAIRLPDDGPYDMLGGGVHELVPSLLAQFSHGNTESIDEIVRDPAIDMYVRWSAVNAYRHLVRDELISRQIAIDSLHVHFQNCEKSEDYDLLAPLALTLGDLAAESALETIRSAFDKNLVDQDVVDLEFIESQIAGGEETIQKTLKHCGPSGMLDTIAQLRKWASFQEEPSPPSELKPWPASVPLPTSVPSAMREPDKFGLANPSTTIRVAERVGRNDPCPCGSGKKYKKCCL